MSQYDLDFGRVGRGSTKPPKRPSASPRKKRGENPTGGDGICCGPSTLSQARMIQPEPNTTIFIVEGQREEAGALCEADIIRKARFAKDRGNQGGTPRSESASLGYRRWSHLLADTHLPRENKREEWFILIADRSCKREWDNDKIELEVRKCAEKALLAGHIGEKTFYNIVSEGRLAADPVVRNHVPRLVDLRNAAWDLAPQSARAKLHPQHMLVDLMRKQRRPEYRHHTASVDAYLSFLRRWFGKR